jgi:hypothetical protein
MTYKTCPYCKKPNQYFLPLEECCRECREHYRTDDSDGADLANIQQKWRNDKIQWTLNDIKKYGLEDRVEWTDRSVVLVDDTFYYSAKSRKVRRKGKAKWYQMKNFSDFYNTFLQQMEKNGVDKCVME